MKFRKLITYQLISLNGEPYADINFEKNLV